MTRLTMQHLLERAELANVQVAPQDRANILQGQRVQRRRHLGLGRILTRMTTRVERSMEARSAQQKPNAAKFVSAYLCGLECLDDTTCAFGARLLKTCPNRFEGVHLGAKSVRYGWWGVASSSCFASLEEPNRVVEGLVSYHTPPGLWYGGTPVFCKLGVDGQPHGLG